MFPEERLELLDCGVLWHLPELRTTHASIGDHYIDVSHSVFNLLGDGGQLLLGRDVALQGDNIAVDLVQGVRLIFTRLKYRVLLPWLSPRVSRDVGQ